MEKQYRVVFVYPDGHIEEIDELFNKGADALEYGNNMLAQIAHTEKFHADPIDDDFFKREKIEPYFMIVEINGKKYRLVFDSRFKR